MAFLAVLARHPELPPVNGDADLRHSHSSTRQYAADALDRLRDALRDLAIGFGQGPRPRHGVVEVVGKLSPIGAQCMDLHRQPILAAVRLAAPLDRGVQCVECKRKPPARSVDRIGFGHAPFCALDL